MTGAERPETLAAFLPKLIRERLARSVEEGPAVEHLQGVLLWVDVSGFTPLVERLAGDTSAGAERLSEVLGSHFGRLIELVEGEGGDVLFLAGDGALALWRVTSGAERAATMTRALAVARRTVAELDGKRPLPEVTIRLRVALSSGPLAALNVGGVGRSWLTLVAGTPLESLGRAASRSAPGEIVVAEGVVERPAVELGGRVEGPLRVAPVDARAMAPYLLPSVVARVEAGESALLAELRSMTVVFVDLSGVGQEPELCPLQELVTIVQTTLGEYGGSFFQLVQDDKGTSAVAVFGLPGHAHEDDPTRAIRFARQLRERLRPELGQASCGVSTGPLFWGPCGPPVRRQLTLVGRPMNRAARLMAAAEGGLLVDEETHRHASRRLRFGAARQLVLKGLDEPLTVFPGEEVAPEADGFPNGFVGRAAERGRLVERIEALMARGEGGVALVRGPAGIGKTSLLSEVGRACAARGCRTARAAGDFIESHTPLYALRGALRELLGVSSVMSPDDVTEGLARAMREVDESAALLPLVGQTLGFSIADSAIMGQMTAAVRAENRNRILLALVAAAVRRARWTVVVDDLHWSDSATVALLPQLAELPGVLWVLASRDEGAAVETLAALARRGSDLPLPGLAGEEIAALAGLTLGARTIPDALTALLVARAEGNPLYARELALVLQETKRLTVVDGRCAVAPSFRPEAVRDLPTSLSALIKSRVDRLPLAAQTPLRVASVIGQWFERRVLAAVLGAAEAGDSAERLDERLHLLVGEGFLQPERRGDEAGFAFGHAAIQAVVYELLPERRRAELHRATGTALERAYAETLAVVHGRLSHHWTEAGEPAKATEYSALAARGALEGYANRDAVELFERALRNQQAWRGPAAENVDRARLFAGLAEAHYGLTQVPEARRAFESALRIVGFADPGAARGVLRGIVGYLARSGLARGAGSGATPMRPEAQGTTRERLLAAIGMLGEWIVLDFWEGRLIDGAAKAFMGHALAQSVISSPLAAEAVARLGYVLSVTPFRFLAERELLRGVKLAVRSGDLQATASALVFLGMYYTLSGRSAEAIAPLEQAKVPVEKLGAGLWRHRAWFMLGETLLCLGRLEEARAAFARAAEISLAAEPPVAGMSTSLGALALARLGRLEEALAELDGPGGLPLITGNFLPLMRFASLGVKAEVLARLGRVEEALAVTREARALAANGQHCEVFFAGLHGFAGMAEALLADWRRARGEGVRRARADARRACRRLFAFARLYPAARPRAELLWGAWLQLDGRAGAGRRVVGRALARAARMQLPFEQAAATRFLAGEATDDRRA